MATAMSVKLPGHDQNQIAANAGASGPVKDPGTITWKTTLADTSFATGDVVLTFYQGGQVLAAIGFTTAAAGTLGNALGGTGATPAAATGP